MPTTPPGPSRRRSIRLIRRDATGSARADRTARPARRAERLRPTGRGPRHTWLRYASDRAWRLLVVGAVVYVVFVLLGKLQLIAVAVFVGLVLTSVLRPPVELLARRMPRALAVLVSLVGSLLLIAGLLALVGEVVAAESGQLAKEFAGGMARIEHWLEGPPFHVSPTTISRLRSRLGTYIAQHRSALISRAVNEAGRAVEVATGAALAVFCSVFFLHSGARMWAWFRRQLSERVRHQWERGGRTAWETFAGYTRGIVIVAATNAILVGIGLFILRVPLALPLTLLEFFASFVPLIGSPVAMAIASVVALAARGPVIALVVLGMIVLIGQLEGHVLHPLVMSWAVQLHPVVVAVSVLGGGLVAGVVGAVVAVPLVSVVWAVFRELRSTPP